MKLIMLALVVVCIWTNVSSISEAKKNIGKLQKEDPANEELIKKEIKRIKHLTVDTIVVIILVLFYCFYA